MADLSSSERNVSVAQKKGQTQLQSLQDEMNNLFRNFFGDVVPQLWSSPESNMAFVTCPAIDVVETEKEYKITTELPGMDVKDVSITLNEGFVTIKGEKKDEIAEEKNGYFRQERSFGEFKRVIALPPNMANEDMAEATMSKGILTVTVPKKADAQAKVRKLDIKQAA